MTLFIYTHENRQVVAEFTGESNRECEAQASDYTDTDYYGWTYTPAFGTTDGLIEMEVA